MTYVLRALILALFAIGASTPSEARYACAVKRTLEGYVALRQGPSARHPEVGKMKPQELVGLLHPPDYENIGPPFERTNAVSSSAKRCAISAAFLMLSLSILPLTMWADAIAICAPKAGDGAGAPPTRDFFAERNVLVHSPASA